MKKTTTLILAFILCTIAPVNTQAQTTVWFEDFEGDWTVDWHADAGTWEAGIPISGPGSAYNGDKCAATVLGGNYNGTVSSRLIRHTSFTVPSPPIAIAAAYPKLAAS